MTKSSSLAFALLAMFTLNGSFAFAEEPADDPQVKSDIQTHPEKPTHPKEESADKKPAVKDAAKSTEDPDCE